MKTVETIFQLGSVILIFCVPIFVVIKNYGFIKTNMIAVPLVSFLIVLGSVSPHFFKDVRLSLMNVNIEGMSKEERTKNVKPELREEAEELYWSLMGVGWPLTAMIWIVFLAPYPSLIFGVKILIKRLRHESK
jgi:hypothetical protein